MIYLMPMAGEGSRFKKEGYTTHKPVIPTTDWRTGHVVPMVIAAAQDLPSIQKDSKIIFVDREFHRREGIQTAIQNYFSNASFVTLSKLTDGQTCSCLEARELLNKDQELVIGGCDNGMIFDPLSFDRAKRDADVLVFTYRNNEAVLKNPNAYGWVAVDSDSNVLNVSVKKSISDNPMKDHAIVSSFWYKKAQFFLDSSHLLIEADDRINNEFYIDQSINYCLKMGLKVKVFEIDRYLCWGTPQDYENYQNTIQYWKNYNDKL
jgi:bifunctional N-acetylglucosamine-1-phosphate-uridyltransferase/glucosamine-1-phosphate-acetyltransferase GlmU-like protein